MTNGNPVAQQAPSRPRLFYIDNLRILLTAQVIVHHLAIGYGGPGGFAYYEDGPISTVSTIVMTLLLGISQAYFMGFFFLISSYFAPPSYDRKGAWPYLKDRLIRLGIPLLFYILVIDPLFSYGLSRNRGYPGSLGEFLRLYLDKYRVLGVGPLWFVEVLLIFSVIYVLYRLVFRPEVPPAPSESKAPRNGAIAGLALVMGMLTFVVRIWLPVDTPPNLLGFQFPFFVQYITLLVVGVLAYRRNWFESLTVAQGKFWGWAALALVLLLPVLFVVGGGMEGDPAQFLGGVRWQSLAYALWEQFMCMAAIVALLVLFRTRLNRQGALAKKLSAASYAAYIFPQPVLVVLMIALGGIRFDMGLKWLLVAPLAVSLCFLVGYGVKSLPVARRIV